MNIYILLASIILLLCLSYIISNRDIMSPSVLFCSGYLLACFCCLLNVDKWGVNLQWKTCSLIIIGITAFVIGDSFGNVVYSQKHFSTDDMSSMSYIKISTGKVLAFCLFDILVLVLTMKDILSISGGWKSSLGLTVGAYRYAYSYTEAKVSSLVVQLIKISKGAAYAFLYIFMNNVYVSKKNKYKSPIIRNVGYALPIMLYVFITLLRGGRINLVMVLISGLFLLYFFWHRNVGWNRTISMQFTKRIIIAFIIFAVSFYGVRELVGRQNQLSFFDYITAYLGGSFELLDEYIRDGVKGANGLETFPGILQSLQKLGFSSVITHKSLEFRSTSTGIYLGNIYTGLRRYYNDFGYIGVMTVPFLFGGLFRYLYSKIRKAKIVNTKIAFLVTIYGSYLFSVISHAMEDHFWIDLGVGLIIELFIMWFIFRCVFDFKLSSAGRIKRARWHE